MNDFGPLRRSGRIALTPGVKMSVIQESDIDKRALVRHMRGPCLDYGGEGRTYFPFPLEGCRVLSVYTQQQRATGLLDHHRGRPQRYHRADAGGSFTPCNLPITPDLNGARQPTWLAFQNMVLRFLLH